MGNGNSDGGLLMFNAARTAASLVAMARSSREPGNLIRGRGGKRIASRPLGPAVYRDVEPRRRRCVEKVAPVSPGNRL